MNVTVDPRPDLPDGCRVKSSIEGTLRRTAHNHAFVVTDDGRAHGLDVTDPAVTTERIPEPEKPWQSGDCVTFPREHWTYVRGLDGRWVNHNGAKVDTQDVFFSKAAREGSAIVLVRGGEVVQP